MKREPVPEEYKPLLAQFGLGRPGAPPATLCRYGKGEFLCHAGEPPKEIIYIIRGRVKVSVTSKGGKTLLFCFYENEGIIASIEVLTGRALTATVQATTEALCLAAPIGGYDRFFHTDPVFLDHLGTTLSDMFAKSSRNSAINILYPLETRLCSYILLSQEDGLFRENLTETSELLGASYRHLLRTLEGLCGKGLLRKEAQGYRLADPAALDALAEDYYSM